MNKQINKHGATLSALTFFIYNIHLKMTTPRHSGKYRFQVQLKGVCLPITITIPDIFNTTPGNDDSIGFLTASATEPDHVASDFTSQPFPSVATPQSEDAQASGTTTDSMTTDSATTDLPTTDLPTTDSPDISLSTNELEILSVSVFCSVCSQFLKHNTHRVLE